MLYESLSQPLIFFYLFLAGFLAGIIFDIANLTAALCGKSVVVRQILQFVCAVLSAFLLFIVNLTVNYGRFRLYVPITFIVALIIERIILGNLWTKFINKCYNTYTKWKKKDKKD